MLILILVDGVSMFNDVEMVVAIRQGDAIIPESAQSYNEYAFGKRSPNLLAPLYGGTLKDILSVDLNVISFGDNKAKLTQIMKSNNPQTETMRLLGRVAEAVVVRKCQTDEEVNCRLFALARRIKGQYAKKEISNQYLAIGTGLEMTRLKYNHFYDRNNPQRDIVWVHKTNNILASMKGATSTGANTAGLQIKTSIDGWYLKYDIISRRYMVPILYFPIMNDYTQILAQLEQASRMEMLDPTTGEYRRFKPEDDFVDASIIDPIALDELKNYYHLLYDVYSGTHTVDELFNWTILNDDKTMKAAILKNTIENITNPPIIV